jgi:hypothetical protein
MAYNTTNSTYFGIRNLLHSPHSNGNSTSTDEFSTSTIVVFSFLGLFAIIIVSCLCYIKINDWLEYRNDLSQNKVMSNNKQDLEIKQTKQPKKYQLTHEKQHKFSPKVNQIENMSNEYQMV